MDYRSASLDVVAPPRAIPAPSIVIAMGVGGLALALAGLWAVVAFGLFSAPPALALVPVAGAVLVAVATARTARRSGMRWRAPRRYVLSVVLAILAFAVSGLAAFAWTSGTLHPPAPMHFDVSPMGNLNHC